MTPRLIDRTNALNSEIARCEIEARDGAAISLCVVKIALHARLVAARRSRAWADLETRAAEILKGQRDHTRWDLFTVRDDIHVRDFPELKIDAKYRQRHSFHALLADIRGKYCKRDGDVPVLVTRTARESDIYCTVPLEYFAGLLDAARELKTQRAGNSPAANAAASGKE
jgi:hypothetical protein